MRLPPAIASVLLAAIAVCAGAEAPSAIPTPGREALRRGGIVLTGHFEDRDGYRIAKPIDVFPATLREFVDLKHSAWHTQIRVFRDDGQMLLNELSVDNEGQFRINLPAPAIYRFELNPTESFRFVDPRVTVNTATEEIVLVIEPKPYCVYGSILDARAGTPVTGTIDLYALGANYTATRAGSSRYALFFDGPRIVELHLTERFPGNTYRAETMQLNVVEAVQQRDFQLERLAEARDTIALHVEIEGVEFANREWLSVFVDGERNFFTEKRGATTAFDFLLPEPGAFNVTAAREIRLARRSGSP